MEWIAMALLVVLVPMLILCLSNRWLGAWACRVFGWHFEPKEQGFDGCSFTGTCPRCNKPVLQDSQGNWF
jgi:hypothetical protein